ncbi:MAG: Mrp/NBP35 family ATP-binding protein [Flavobacteriales bacterium]|jgi:ATP-binding protein involved in chromosome partitioning|tara:strand:+ start:410 stop:1540 length:1131 start_codon:yes stop_codon:yes gene_type:complete
MNIQKSQIEEALKSVMVKGEEKSLIENGLVTNIVVFGDEVNVDITINNPTLHAKKQVEVDILKAIHAKVYAKAKITVKVTVEVKQIDKPTVIKGEKIKGVKNIIAVASGKGGVGKSTVTANLAVALQKQGFKVGIVDADIYGPSQHIMFDVEKSRPEARNVNGKPVMIPVESCGVKLVSIGFFAPGSQAVVWRGPMATKALNQLIKDSYWGELDYLLIDLPPGTGDVHLSLVQAVPVTGAVIVSTPQIIAIADAKKGVGMFQLDTIQVPVLGLVENMSYFTPDELPDNKYYIFGKDGTKNLADDLNLPLLAEIPLVQAIREASDIGRPVVLQEDTPSAKAFMSLACNVVEQVELRNKNLEATAVVEITNMDGCSSK